MSEWVQRARAALGVPFRPQGRDVSSGLDCVGLTIHAYKLDATLFRRDYRLRGVDADEVKRALEPFFRGIARTRVRSGDLVLARVGTAQIHLAIATDQGLIHADAGLRKVVERPGPSPWPIIAAFRRRVRKPR